MGRFCASANFRRAARVITRHYEKELRGAGVSATQLPLLAAINAGINTSIAALADALDLERSTISRELAILERHALIAVEEGNDKRTRVLKLTPRGHKMLAAAFRAWKRAHAAIVGAYGDQPYELLLTQVKSLGRAVQAIPSRRKQRAR